MKGWACALDNFFGGILMGSVDGKRVLAIAADIGGWNATAPVLGKLQQEGAYVCALLLGASGKAYDKGSLVVSKNFFVMTDLEDCLPIVDVVVIGASQSEGGTRATAGVLRSVSSRIPVLVVEDMYGSSIPILTELEKMFFLPWVCVIDMVAKANIIARHFKLRIVVTGGPQFDRVAEMKKNWAERREIVRKDLQVPKDGKLFLIAGQHNGTAEALVLLEDVVERADDWVLIRQHPGATALDKRLTAAAIKSFPYPCVLSNDKVPAALHSNEDFLPAADVVLSGYSTTLLYAILCGMPGTVFVGTPSFKWDLWQEKKLLMSPEASMGAGWYVWTPDEMRHVMEELAKGDESEELQIIKYNQALLAQYADGHATERVAQAVMELMA